MAPRRRCPTCGSKQWHKEPSSGLIACSEGHVLQDYRNETTEITEVGPHAMHKRTLKSGRKKKGYVSKADPKLYHGARARYHYFLCLQLILRKQITALLQVWELPAEFEVICRDIWALHLSLLPDPPSAEPYYHAQENRTGEPRKEGAEDQKVSSATAKTKNEMNQPYDSEDSESSEIGGQDDDDKNVEPEGERGQEGDAGEDEVEEDPELEALMRENSELSSSSSEGEKISPIGNARKKGKKKGHPAIESPVSTIAVLVVACWTLRIPVMLRDFTRLVENYELPYLDPAVRVLPLSMVEHLTKHDIQALSPPHAPRTLAIHTVASRMAKKIYATYGVYTPECNAASLLWRLTKEMAGTPLLYRLAKRTASVLSVPLALHSSLSGGRDQAEDTDGTRHQYDDAPPEVALLACIIIVLKLVYGLDGQERVPMDAEDVACGLPECGEYLRELEKRDEEDLQKKEVRFGTRSNLNVGDMGADELDSYMDLCEQALLGSRDDDGGLERYFPIVPIERTDARAHEERARCVFGGRPGGGGTGVRPGGEYKIWQWRDVDGRGCEAWAAVVGRATRVSGVDGVYMGGVVGAYEGRLVRWTAGRGRCRVRRG
ncbi:hypothetical protein BDN70DRAFT_847983 [Pholiota conissans]|uniref:RRN7-type domain-containing protein n=1 Tax=Pholiota conissans TaxID=109636 RepID=A0A9P6D6V6_9AGAR|nr:hypothetical protein BDN70DRAFT_847983 [Pholiota conissans]